MPELSPSPDVARSDHDAALPMAQEVIAAPPIVEATRRPDILQHSIFLAMSIGVIIASLTLGVGESKKVELPGIGIPLPSVCQFKNFTGIDCPGCGLSRAFIHLGHGDFPAAWRLNAAAALVFVFVALQIPYRSVQLWRIARGEPELDFRRVGHWAITAVAVALLAQWLVKMAWWMIG